MKKPQEPNKEIEVEEILFQGLESIKIGDYPSDAEVYLHPYEDELVVALYKKINNENYDKEYSEYLINLNKYKEWYNNKKNKRINAASNNTAS